MKPCPSSGPAAIAALLLILHGPALHGAGPWPQPQGAAAGARHTLTIARDTGVTFITLKADGASVSDVAADLSRQLGVPIVVSRSIAAQPLSISFLQFALEPALSTLAPRAYVDYEVRAGRDPVPEEIHLLGADEPQPPPRGPAQGILITGHTDEVVDPANDPLRLSYENDRLTILSDRQPLAVVVAAVGEMLNVPYEIEYAATETVDVTLTAMLPESALLRLSPNIRVHVRADLYRGSRAIQRIVLASPQAP